jgi:hypothetical protein
VNEQGPPGVSAPIQFDQVELPAAAAIKMCAICHKQITDTYYEAGGAVLCSDCSDKLTGRTAGLKAFPRALLFGAGAALLGTIVWFLIMKIANMELGIVAIAVGFFVGRAVRVGSGGMGGWKYQALAIFLTYASICSSYVPFILKGIEQASAEKKTDDDKKAGGAEGADQAKSGDGTAAKDPAASSQINAEKAEKGGGMSLVVAFAIIFGLALASPFMAGFENIMGLIIIAIALYEAWKLNKRIPVSGPFRMAGPAVASGAPIGGPPAGSP